MKLITFFGFVFMSLFSFSQGKVIPTESFIIQGKIKNSTTFSARAIDSFPSKTLGDITAVNHKGEVLSVRKNVKGILLKDILLKLQLDSDNPKELNSYYFILEGTDGYKFVLSYTDVFISNNVFIISESNGKSWKQSTDRVAVLILADGHKGRIAMKGLYKLIVEKI